MSVQCKKCDFKFMPSNVEELNRISEEHHKQHHNQYQKFKLLSTALKTLTQESQSNV